MCLEKVKTQRTLHLHNNGSRTILIAGIDYASMTVDEARRFEVDDTSSRWQSGSHRHGLRAEIMFSGLALIGSIVRFCYSYACSRILARRLAAAFCKRSISPEWNGPSVSPCRRVH